MATPGVPSLAPRTAPMHGSQYHIAHAIGSSTSRRLAEIQRLYGLDARTLRALSENLELVGQSDYQPSLERFQADVAEPRQHLFVLESELALTAGAGLVAELLDDMSPTADVEARRRVVECFDRSLNVPRAVLKLGDRWHRRLRLAAARHVISQLPESLAPSGSRSTATGQSIVEQYRSAELTIVDWPPWNYQDRLLSAYEAADREVMEARTSLVGRLCEAAIAYRDDDPTTTTSDELAGRTS